MISVTLVAILAALIMAEEAHKGYLLKATFKPRKTLQAEKDLALTWEDIRELDEWISAVQTSDNLSGEELYKEVLKRFNEYKEERK